MNNLGHDIHPVVENITPMPGEITRNFGDFYARQCPDGFKGYGCFASCDLPRDRMLCEYRGYRLTKKDGDAREHWYETNGHKMAMIWIYNASPKFCVDGLNDEQDVPFGPYDNPGNLFNHSRPKANCVLFRKQRGMKNMKLYLRTTQSVTAHTELIWNYGDYAKDLPPWFNA